MFAIGNMTKVILQKRGIFLFKNKEINIKRKSADIQILCRISVAVVKEKIDGCQIKGSSLYCTNNVLW